MSCTESCTFLGPQLRYWGPKRWQLVFCLFLLQFRASEAIWVALRHKLFFQHETVGIATCHGVMCETFCSLRPARRILESWARWKEPYLGQPLGTIHEVCSISTTTPASVMEKVIGCGQQQGLVLKDSEKLFGQILSGYLIFTLCHPYIVLNAWGGKRVFWCSTFTTVTWKDRGFMRVRTCLHFWKVFFMFMILAAGAKR